MKQELQQSPRVVAWIFVLCATMTAACADTTSVVVQSPVSAGTSETCYAPDTYPDGGLCLERAVPMPMHSLQSYEVPDSLLTEAEMDQLDQEIEALSAEIQAAPLATDAPTTSTTPSTSTTTTLLTTTSSTTVVPTTVGPCVFDGFFTPVDNAPIVNLTNAGAAVPIKFGFCSSGSLAIFAASSPSSAAHPCGSAPSDEIEEVGTLSTSGLTFDPSMGRYQYNWKTDKSWKGQCRTLSLRFTNGTSQSAEFKFR